MTTAAPRLRLVLPLALVAALGLAACEGGNPLARDPVLSVTDGTLRPGVTPERPAAAYFTVNGGPQPVELVAVTAAAAQRVEMHETVRENGVTSMRAITRVPVAKGETVRFAPGGRHVMLFGLNQSVAATGKVPMVFIFSNNDRIVQDMRVVDPAAEADAHAGMDHGAGHGTGDGAAGTK